MGEQAGARGTPPTIVVAEDMEEHRLILRRVFRAAQLDAKLHFVGDGGELLDYLREAAAEHDERWPRVVLLDLHMPGTDGMEALARIRADDALRRLPVVMLSGSDQPHHVERAYDTGANAYLVKLGDFERLVTQMRRFAVFWLETSLVPDAPDPAAGHAPSPR